MSLELKPCPFCGGKPFFSRHMFQNANFAEMGWEVTIMCSACGVYTPEESKVLVHMDMDGNVDYDREIIESIAKWWNRRHDE